MSDAFPKTICDGFGCITFMTAADEEKFHEMFGGWTVDDLKEVGEFDFWPFVRQFPKCALPKFDVRSNEINREMSGLLA